MSMLRRISKTAKRLTFTEFTVLNFLITSATACGVVTGLEVENTIDRLVVNYTFAMERVREHPAQDRMSLGLVARARR